MSTRLTQRLSRMQPSATAAVFQRVAELRASGVDVISLAVGEPDAEPPPHVLAAARAAIDSGASRYTEVAGLRSLREAICADSALRRGVRHDPDQVVVGAGAKHALFNLALALFEEGDEVLIPTPAWGTYAEQVRLCGAEPVLLPCAAADGYLLRPEALAGALGPRVQGLVLCSPSNPTGAVYTRSQLEALAAPLRAHHAVIVVDEIYAELTYATEPACSILQAAPDLIERVAVVDGVSKRFAMTGYRVGWVLCSRDLAAACRAVQSQATTSIAVVSQLAAQAALEGPDDSVRAMRAELELRRDRVLAALAGLDGLYAHRPDGAFYVMVDVSALAARRGEDGPLGDDRGVARYLLDHARVAVVPGSDFGAPGTVRLSYATSLAQLEAAFERIGAALDRLD